MTFITEEEAIQALVAAGITGPHQSHPRRNAIGNMRALSEGDPDKTFGMPPPRYSTAEILGFMAAITGCSPDVDDLGGYDNIDPRLTVGGIAAAGRRLADEARRGATLLIATGHPTGLLEHHIHVAESYQSAGGKLVRPLEGERRGINGRRLEVRYTGGVGCLADGASLLHTHGPGAMEVLLESEPWPDVVFADHGFAGAAIRRGIPAIAIMDINDPALAVAAAEDNDVIVIPMDDNRVPRTYEPSWRLLGQALSGTAQSALPQAGPA